jgi:1,2-diacylglycerol 3-beta-galactosyltransferase
MNNQDSTRPRILFLFSDTGGGHRSAAEAIIEAIHLTYGDAIQTEMVDIFAEFAPRPLNYLPAIYPRAVRVPQIWQMGFRLSDGRKRVHFINTTVLPYIRSAVRKLVSSYPSNLIVSVHPLANETVLRALGRNHPPFITVVTDLITGHAWWFARDVDLCIVPTEAASQRARMCGIDPKNLRVIGLPVANRFCAPAGEPQEIRARLGWPLERPVVLLVGGGEGMGPLESIAKAIAASGEEITLIVIAGRNEKLRTRLQEQNWPIPTFIYGFVREMPDFMRAASILVTKAGPGTISEAFIASLPMVLYSRLPGQEEGNVHHVLSEGAGVWAPRSDQIVRAIQHWLDNPQDYQLAVEACKRLARPQAAQQIAETLVEFLNSNHPDKSPEGITSHRHSRSRS